ncbi:DUF1389 domain-containing protein [Chlamydia sp. 04-14]
MLIVCSVVSVVLAVVFLAKVAQSYKRQVFDTSLPSGFLNVIKKEFPEILYELIVQQRLTLQELRAVITGLSSGVFTFPSRKCQEKVERFGLERL